MRTLILSCNTGEGHNSCAKAIKEYYELHGGECTIADALRFVSPAVSKIVSRGHSFLYRHFPGVSGFGYGCAEKSSALFRENSWVCRLLMRGTERLYQYILDGAYTAVICTHIFAALMLSDILKKHPIPLKTGFVATDYTCSPGAKESSLDYYFIPDAEFVPDFQCENLPEEKLVPSGIPVRQMFYASCASEEAKVGVGVNPKHHHMLMMCGSMGCGPMKKLLAELSSRLPQDWALSVICGNNERLYTKLSQKYKEKEQIHIRGFVKDMGAMMDSADLYITKPGGISVSESAVKKLPMILVDAVAGCETYNRIWFVRKGGAQTAEKVNALVELCVELMNDCEKRQKMREHLDMLSGRNAAKIIYSTMQE